MKGINLITLYYTDVVGNSYPINFRLYDKGENKTKNAYFREIVVEVKAWGVRPAWVTRDSWYSSIENLKFLKNEGLSFVFGITNNRKISLEKGSEVQVKTLTIPESGLVVYLKEFGRRYFVRISKTKLGITS